MPILNTPNSYHLDISYNRATLGTAREYTTSIREHYTFQSIQTQFPAPLIRSSPAQTPPPAPQLTTAPRNSHPPPTQHSPWSSHSLNPRSPPPAPPPRARP